MLKRSSIFAALILVLSSTGWGLQLSDLITAVRLRTRDSTVDVTRQQYSDAQITADLNEAQRDLVNRTWLLTSTTAISITANVRTYSLPNDFLAVQRVTLNGIPITEVTLQGLDSNQTNWTTVSNSSGSSSIQYYVDHSQSPVQLGLYPIISTTMPSALLIYYTQQAANLVNNTDVPFNSRLEFYQYHDLLVDYASFLIWAAQEAMDIAKPYLEIYMARAQIMQNNTGKMPNFNPAVRGDRGPSSH